jgi:uroporphyrinogen decarboxylase
LWDDDDAFAKCQLDYYKATELDFMKLSGDKYFGWPDPVLSGIKSADELYKMQVLPKDHPWIRSFVERTKKVVAALEGDCYTFMLIYVPISYLRLQTDYPTMMRLIRENPDAMKYALNVITQSLKLLIDGLIDEAGVDGCFYSVQDAEVDRFTEEEYLNWLKPSEMELLAYMNTKSDMNIIHFCAWEGVPNRLSVWKDYHAPVISWSRYIDTKDINEMRDWTGGSTVWGGFDNRSGTLLYTGTKERSRPRSRTSSTRPERPNSFSAPTAASIPNCLRSASAGWWKRPRRSDRRQNGYTSQTDIRRYEACPGSDGTCSDRPRGRACPCPDKRRGPGTGRF